MQAVAYSNIFGRPLLQKTEAVIRRYSLEKVFLANSQNSQENTCAKISFLIKLEALGLQLY